MKKTFIATVVEVGGSGIILVDQCGEHLLILATREEQMGFAEHMYREVRVTISTDEIASYSSDTKGDQS